MTVLKFFLILALALGAEPRSSIGGAHPGAEVTPAVAESRILFSREMDGDAGWSILSINSQGEDERIEVPFSSGMGEYNPALAPDGESLIFNTYRYGGWKLATQRIGGGEVARWSEGGEYYTNGVYSPDGRYVAYEFTRQTGTDIQVRVLETGREYNLTAGAGDSDERVPSWTPDGRTLIYFSDRTGNQQIHAQPASGGPPINLSQNDANDFSPGVSPDGSRIAFFSDRSGHADLFVMNVDGNDQTNLTRSLHSADTEYEFGGRTYWTLKASWSPDGSAIVFNGMKDGNQELYVAAADGSDVRRLSHTDEAEITPVWGMVVR